MGRIEGVGVLVWVADSGSVLERDMEGVGGCVGVLVRGSVSVLGMVVDGETLPVA